MGPRGRTLPIGDRGPMLPTAASGPVPAAGARGRTPRTGWPLRLLGVGCIALLVVISLRPAFSRFHERVGEALDHRGESAVEARRRCLGAAFVARADELRAGHPPAEPYYLVEGDNPKHGGALMVRFELAPRPAVFLGPFTRLAAGDPARLRRQIASARIHRVVVAFRPRQPPLGWRRADLLAAVERRAALSRSRSPK
jgi:hypothetical protein